MLRESQGLPLRKVAAYLDIDQSVVSKFESGNRKPNKEQVKQLAEFFKMEEEELMVLWLSDKVVHELGDESLALKAMQLAEERIMYKAAEKLNNAGILKKIRNYFSGDKRVQKAWVFGSFARGEEKPGSDMDIMIAMPEKEGYTLYDLADIQYKLEQIVKRSVDLVESGAVKPFAWHTIQKDLQLVYER